MSNTTVSPIFESVICVLGIIGAGLSMGNAMRLMMHYGAPCRLLSSTTERRVLQAIILGFWLSLPLVLVGAVFSLTDGVPWLMACGYGWLVFFLPVTSIKQFRIFNRRYHVYREANKLIAEGRYATLVETSPEWQHKYRYYALARMPAEGCPEQEHITSL